MSLIRRHHILVASAALVAIAAPLWLLRPGEGTREDTLDLQSHISAVNLTNAAPIDPAVLSHVFSPSRAPDLTLAMSGETMNEAAQAAPAASVPLLVGLVTRPRGAAVALARGGDGTTQLLKSGDSLDGWRLVGIGRDSVTFEMGGDRQVSMLDFRNRTNMPQSTSASPPGAGVSTIAMPEGTGE